MDEFRPLWRLHRRRWPWLVAAVGALAAIAGGAVALGLWPTDAEVADASAAEGAAVTDPPDLDEFDLPQPDVVTLPDPVDEVVDDVRAFLHAEGQALLEFHEETAALLIIDLDDRQEAAEQCRQRAETTLTPIAEDPDELVVLASEIPEDDTAVMAMNAVTAARDFVAVCAANDERPKARELQAETYFTHVVFDRRLDQLEMAR